MYTISVRATELERSYPYGVVRQTADSVQLDKSEEERAALFTGAAKLALPILEPGGDEDGDNPELMYQRLHGLYWLIANLARQQPLLICVDDAQWADEASMAAERFLSLRIADLPMVLLLAARPAEVGQLAVPLAEILADPGHVSIRPGPLSDDGAGAPRRDAARLGRPRLRRRLPPRDRRKPVPARAARQRDPRGAHRAERRERRARRLARPGHRAGVGAAAARAAAERGRPGGARARGARRDDVTLKDVATLADVPEDAAADALAELERSGLVPARRGSASSTRSCAPRSRTTCPPWSAPARTSRRRGCSPTARPMPWRWPRTCWCPTRARATGRAPRSGVPRGARRRSATRPPRCATWSAP